MKALEAVNKYGIQGPARVFYRGPEDEEYVASGCLLHVDETGVLLSNTQSNHKLRLIFFPPERLLYIEMEDVNPGGQYRGENRPLATSQPAN